MLEHTINEASKYFKVKFRTIIIYYITGTYIVQVNSKAFPV